MLVGNDKGSLLGYTHILVPDSKDLAGGSLTARDFLGKSEQIEPRNG